MQKKGTFILADFATLAGFWNEHALVVKDALRRNRKAADMRRYRAHDKLAGRRADGARILPIKAASK